MSKCIGCGEQSLREAIPGEYFCLLCMGATHRVREIIEQLNQMEREALGMTEEEK